MTTKYLALIVDDEPDILELLGITLGRMDIGTHAAENMAQAQDLLTQYEFDLCLTDMKLPDGNGIKLVEHIQKQYPCLPVAMITAHGNMEAAIQALKAGAFDFVSKPVELQMLRNLVNTALKLSDKSTKQNTDESLSLLGESEAIKKVRSKIEKLARSQAPIYISGESGSGKELAARLIHNKGARSDNTFVPVNCGAIPETLIESELFGHKKGSFTGATADKQGLFQAADGGTLFLDEIADLPLHMQVKLLRAIQEKAVRPVGAEEEIPVDVRILCATHKDLKEEVEEGRFRQDLFYRINVIELHITALRERSKDIPLLAEHFLNQIALTTNTDPHSLSKNAVKALQEYQFPGNVRELENILERATTLCEASIIEDDDLQLPENGAQGKLDTENELPLESHLDTIEKERIQKALEKTKYNKTAAAKLLGITFRALRYRLKKLGLE